MKMMKSNYKVNKLNYKILTLLLLFSTVFISVNLEAQKSRPGKKNILVAFYNVENLFDTIDDPEKNDNEFLPTSEKAWDSAKYQQKLQNLSMVLSSIDSTKLPDIIGLAEIENQKVVSDLSLTGKMATGNYKIVHYESPDRRSIDVALLYRPDVLKPTLTTYLPIYLKEDKNFKTRDILYVTFYHFKSKDTLHVFINHWPSRSGGQEKSEPKRIAAAKILKKKTDEILHHNPNAKILIMGDLNDEPSDTSVRHNLGAFPVDSSGFQTSSLYNLCYPKFTLKQGSYYYSRDHKWNMLDHIIVSQGLIYSESGIKLFEQNVRIFSPKWILYENKDGTFIPSKTYGSAYIGGYSDHLPVYQYFTYKKVKL